MIEYDVTSLRPSWVRKIQVTHVKGVSVDGPCWLWQGARSKARGGSYYGRVCVPNQARAGYIHRVVYELLVGPIPDGLQLDHLCRQTTCCNPKHLEPVTCRVNVRRGAKGMQTHCKRGGHPLSGDNLYVYTSKRGVHRTCRACRDENMAKFKAALKERKRATWARYLPEQEEAA